MTLNEVNIIKNSVLDATEAYVDAVLNSSAFVKTQIGVVQGTATLDANNKYRHTVVCNKIPNVSSGITYTNVLSVGNIQFPNNSVVFIIIPNAQASNQFILGKLDTSPCHINGGSISIGVASSGSPFEYYFNVDNNGNVSIYNGSIKLGYNSTLRDYNFKVDSNGINLGITGTTTSNKSYNFTVNNNGKVAIKSGSINLGFISNNKYNFTVTDLGVVTIRNGSILLGETSSGSNNYNVNINSTGLGLGYNSSRPNNYNFTVDTSGNMNMYQGTINLGTSSSTSSGYAFHVSTNGSIESVSGYIGGFKITNNSLGDPLGTTKAVGMISGDHLYSVYNQYGVRIYYDEINCENAVINVSQGGSTLQINHSNIYCDDKHDNVVWHSELNNSDRRNKNNIIDLDTKTSKQFINSLLPKEYEFIPNENRNLKKGKRYGFIAQDVEKIVNKDYDIVYEDEEEYKHLNYNDIIAPLVKVVQEQQKEIDKLKSKLGVK